MKDRPWALGFAAICAVVLISFGPGSAGYAEPAATSQASLGPYNLRFLQGGIGLKAKLPADGPLPAEEPWSLSFWLAPDFPGQSASLIEFRAAETGQKRQVSLEAGELAFELGSKHLVTPAALPSGVLTPVSISYASGRLRVFVGGKPAWEAAATSPAILASMELAPEATVDGGRRHFGGVLAGLVIAAHPLADGEAEAFAAQKPDLRLLALQTVGAGWPVQKTAWIGLTEAQDGWTLPHSKAAFSAPVAKPIALGPELAPTESGAHLLKRWKLAEAAQAKAEGAQLSTLAYDDQAWRPATVPGTVLTTLIDRGVYPDPDYGLNNMAIPEDLSRRDWWYRTTFQTPKDLDQRPVSLVFKGINYQAEVWLNGERLGTITGAFVRGDFDVTGRLTPGARNALAVRIIPPPHPGIPSEESVAFGPGENGGSLAIDGPTFVATEGWDWIPGIRDRNIGIWQDVELRPTAAIRFRDPYVVSHVKATDLDHATLDVIVPLENRTSQTKTVKIAVAFEGVAFERTVQAPSGLSEVRFSPDDTPDLTLTHPRLWWPNGYGKPELYHMRLSVTDSDGGNDQAAFQFGVREISYDLSLFDHTGRLRRVEVMPSEDRGTALIDVRHSAINRVEKGWAQSLTPRGEVSPAVREVGMEGLAPFLVIRVNGVPIAAHGGSWGMDDSRKRISRARLEPYFRLQREAHINIIRNWLGQNTEDVFYDLADENGLLVLNDFWVSTQDFQIEPQDPALFLQNARDVIRRYRTHPSIAVWFGRNEGVPPPILNEGLADLVTTLDGTRLYTGSSNRVNLQDSGPYNYRPPEAYFTKLAKGFAVELGTPSLATLESLKAMLPEPDRWPLGDVIAYHDWHFGGNGDVASFMQALDQQFGAATSLADFERKAQMMNFVDYRAIFEGFSAGLWTENSGRMLWMSHPAWPSNHWQIYTSDYDAQASYFGVKSALEPVHVQMNLPDFQVAVVNTTRQARSALKLQVTATSLDNRVLLTKTSQVDAPANQTVTFAALPLSQALQSEGLLLVELTLSAANGEVVSRNLYWQGRDASALRALNRLPTVHMAAALTSVHEGDEDAVHVRLENPNSAAALAVKLTLTDATGNRILPAYYSENYVSLLPGERREISIRYPKQTGLTPHVGLRGWNVVEEDIH